MKRRALILGCDDYEEYPGISFCYNDAFEISQILKEYCDYEENDIILEMISDGSDFSTPTEIYDYVQEQMKCLKADDTFLFYYAGHGDVRDGKGFLILPATTNRNIEESALCLDKIYEILSIGECTSFVILDACHSGTGVVEQLHNSGGNERTEIGCVTFASCSDNEMSYPYDENENGVFTYFLTEAIKRHSIHEAIYIERLKLWVCDKVAEWCWKQYEKKQTPTLKGKVIGNIPLAIRNDKVYEINLRDEVRGIVIESARKKYISIVKDRYFVYRNTEIDFIKKNLKEQRIIVLCGMGGIGKTTLAVQYAVEEKSIYDNVIVIPCSNGLARGILEYLSLEGIKRQNNGGILESEEKYGERVLREFVVHPEKKVLFILDDFHPTDPLFSTVCDLPQHVLITTRWDKTKWRLPVAEIGELETAEQRLGLFERYLERSLTENEKEYFEQIDDFVAGHTLTLQLIARQCVESDLSLETIKALLEANGVYSEDNTVFSYSGKAEERNMYGHLKALWNVVSLDETERSILKGLLMIPVTGITKSEFKQWMQLENFNLINSLIQKGWIQQRRGTQNTIFLHAVLAEVINRELYSKEQGEPESLIMNLIPLMQNRVQNYSERLRYLSYGEHTAMLLRPSIFSVELLLALSMEEEYEHKLALAESILDKARDYLVVLGKTNSIQQGHLHNNYGVVYQSRRELQKSINEYRKAAEVYKALGTTGIKHYGYLLHNLARVFQDAGNNKEATRLEDEAEPILREHWKENWGKVYDVRANYYSDYADYLIKKHNRMMTAGRAKDSKIILIQIMQCRKKEVAFWQKAIELKGMYDPDNEAELMVSLAPCACAKAQLKDVSAIGDIQRVYEFYVKSTGENSMQVGGVYSKMCLIYEQLGKKALAIECGKKAIEILEVCMGKESIEYKIALHNLEIAMK